MREAAPLFFIKPGDGYFRTSILSRSNFKDMYNVNE
jgi:hypothetical protein